MTIPQNALTIKVAKSKQNNTAWCGVGRKAAESVTAGELRKTLAAMPSDAPIFVLFDTKMAVFDENGDRIEGKTDEYFEIDGCDLGECFRLGYGFCPSVILSVAEKA